MRGKIILLGLVLVLCGTVASAQNKTDVPTSGELYCSGVVTTQAVPHSTYVITGEESDAELVFNNGDDVFINKGSSQGVKAGDQFFVVRKVKDPYVVPWTKWQSSILHKMGNVWEDEARLKVVVARPKVSIAQVEHACNYVQRGDIVLPFAARPAPQIKPVHGFDQFTPPNGKRLAMIVAAKDFVSLLGDGDIAYVNLGTRQGVKVGDYFRIFRYQGANNETIYQTPRFAFDQNFNSGVKDVGIYGFGSVPSKYNWNNVPRENIGEGLVLRTGPNSSTVLITLSLRSIFPGDYVELE